MSESTPPPSVSPSPGRPSHHRGLGARDPRGEDLGAWVWGSYLVGLGLQLWLWSRSAYAWDQVELTRIGVAFASGEALTGFGKAMSGGGVIPGSLLQLVVGWPLEIWSHFRAPALVVVATQALAGIVLLRLFRRAFGDRVAAIYLAVYWLGPWRLYHSGFIWEPNYLLLPAALHLWATWSLREAPRFGPTVVLALAVVLAPQLHASGVVLGLVTLWLIVRRRIRWSWGGAIAGSALGVLTLIPTITASLAGNLPALAPSAHPGLGFLKVFPVLKGLGYWFRLGSADIGRRLRQVVYFPGEEPGPPGPVAEAGLVTLEILSVATVLVAFVASYRYLVRRAGDPGGELEPGGGFFREYTLGALLALLCAVGLTSQTVQGWHTLVVLHAASIPPALWIAAQRGLPSATWRMAFVALYLAIRIPVALVLGTGHPMYLDPEQPLPLDAARLDAMEDPRVPGDSSSQWRVVP